MLKVIALVTMILANPTFAKVESNLISILTAQKPFYIFPEENNGLYTIEMAYAEDCQVAYRDSLEFHPNRHDRVKYTSTKVFSFSDLEFAFIDYDQAPVYYRVYFGSNSVEAVKIVGAEVEDQRGIRMIKDSTEMQSLLRFKNLEDAEQAWSYLTNNMDKCRK